MVCTDEHLDEELHWQRLLKEKNVPVIWILNKCDLLSDAEQTMRRIEQQCGQVPLLVSTLTGKGLDEHSAQSAKTSCRMKPWHKAS